MEQSPFREANRSSASQEIPGILWNPNVHYRILNSSLSVRIVNPMNPAHNLFPPL
jgi:hypothetical protein